MRSPLCGVLAVLLAGGCQTEAQKCIAGDDVALCEEACERGDGNSCLKLGAMHGLASRPTESLKAFRRACALGMEPGCARQRALEGSGGGASASGLADCDKIADKVVARLNAYLPKDPEARKQAEARHAAVRARTIKRCTEAKLSKAVEECVGRASGLNAIERCMATGN
jgi:hypothetical protein